MIKVPLRLLSVTTLNTVTPNTCLAARITRARKSSEVVVPPGP